MHQMKRLLTSSVVCILLAAGQASANDAYTVRAATDAAAFEEMWAALGNTGLAADQAWPVADPARLVEDTVTVAVQVNGKLRGTIDLAKDCAREAAEDEALKIDTVIAAMSGKPARKIIVVPNKVVNIVV